MANRLLLAWMAAPLVFAQSFEVASIRPHEGPLSMIGFNMQGPNFTATGFSVRNLITFGYDFEIYQVVGIEGANRWTTTDYYNVAAKVPGEGPLPLSDLRKMVQALLTERFQLKLRREMQEMPVYALVRAKGGVTLKDAASGEGGMSMSATEMKFTGAPMQMLVRQLSGVGGVDRPVVDRTSLTGKYDFALKTAADRTTGVTTGPSGESIFTALEEQLGLRLESQRAPMEILVIESVSRPSEN